MRHHLTRTAVYVLAIYAMAWAYGLSGFLPGSTGAAFREHLLGNPANPAIGGAFMLPAFFGSMVMGVRHGRSAVAVAVIIGISYILALTSEWAMRVCVHSWAPLEQPPHNDPFWTMRQFVTILIPIILPALIGAGAARGERHDQTKYN